MIYLAYPVGRHSLLEEQLIPASYLAVETAVKNITAQCYAANQTPVLKAEQFRYVCMLLKDHLNISIYKNISVQLTTHSSIRRVFITV